MAQHLSAFLSGGGGEIGTSRTLEGGRTVTSLIAHCEVFCVSSGEIAIKVTVG